MHKLPYRNFGKDGKRDEDVIYDRRDICIPIRIHCIDRSVPTPIKGFGHYVTTHVSAVER